MVPFCVSYFKEADLTIQLSPGYLTLAEVGDMALASRDSLLFDYLLAPISGLNSKVTFGAAFLDYNSERCQCGSCAKFPYYRLRI